MKGFFVSVGKGRELEFSSREFTFFMSMENNSKFFWKFTKTFKSYRHVDCISMLNISWETSSSFISSRVGAKQSFWYKISLEFIILEIITGSSALAWPTRVRESNSFQLTSWLFVLFWFYIDCLACILQIAKFRTNLKLVIFGNINTFRYTKDIKVKTWKHINNFCFKGSKHPFS